MWKCIAKLSTMSCIIAVTTVVLLPCDVKCAEEVAQDKKNDEFPLNHFVNNNFLSCGGKDVLITTSCVDHVETVSFCFNQHINIFDKQTNNTVSINYNYVFNDGHEAFIVEAACERVDGKDYLVMRSGGPGNCDTCEWIDVYSTNGKYLGSSKGMYDNMNFVHSLLPRRLYDLLTSNKATELNSTEILPVRPSLHRHKSR